MGSTRGPGGAPDPGHKLPVKRQPCEVGLRPGVCRASGQASHTRKLGPELGTPLLFSHRACCPFQGTGLWPLHLLARLPKPSSSAFPSPRPQLLKGHSLLVLHAEALVCDHLGLVPRGWRELLCELRGHVLSLQRQGQERLKRGGDLAHCALISGMCLLGRGGWWQLQMGPAWHCGLAPGSQGALETVPSLRDLLLAAWPPVSVASGRVSGSDCAPGGWSPTPLSPQTATLGVGGCQVGTSGCLWGEPRLLPGARDEAGSPAGPHLWPAVSNSPCRPGCFFPWPSSDFPSFSFIPG